MLAGEDNEAHGKQTTGVIDFVVFIF